MSTPKKYELQSPIKQLRVERYDGLTHHNSGWRVWLTADKNFANGTFIFLTDVGSVERITWHADGSESILEMEGA